MDKAVRRAAVLVTCLCSVLILWLLFKFALPALAPILVALFVSWGLRPLSRFISRRGHVSSKICGGVLIFLVVFAAVYATVILSIKLFGEATELLTQTVQALESDNNIIRRTIDYLKGLWDKVPLIAGGENANIPDEIYSLLLDGVRSAAGKLSEGAASLAAGFLGGLPDLLFALIVSVIAMMYLTVDYDGVKAGVLSFLPSSSAEKVKLMAKSFGGAVSGYVKAYLILGLLTFAGLFIGFVILRVKYSFFLALIISLIDILPVLGAGTVLLPWSGVLFLTGDTSGGVGILLLCVIMYAIRQFIEPRLIGRFMGLHPLITLTGAYVGFKLFGIPGMIFAPLGLFVARLALEEGRD